MSTIPSPTAARSAAAKAARPTPEPEPAASREEQLAAAREELAQLPEMIQAATDAGDEEGLSRLYARRPILVARIERLEVRYNASHIDALRGLWADLHAKWMAADAKRNAIVAEAQALIREANSEAAVAESEMEMVRFEIERMENHKPDSWWHERGMVAPSDPPIAEKVIEVFELSPRAVAFRREVGRNSGATERVYQ